VTDQSESSFHFDGVSLAFGVSIFHLSLSPCVKDHWRTRLSFEAAWLFRWDAAGQRRNARQSDEIKEKLPPVTTAIQSQSAAGAMKLR